MRRILLLVSFLSLSLFLYGHVITLNWSSKDTLFFGDISIPVHSFEGAQYIGDSHLPHFIYSEHISVEDAKSLSFSASIINTSYSLIQDTFPLIKHDAEVDCYLTTARRSHRLEVSICPFKCVNGHIYRLESFELKVSKTPKVVKRVSKLSHRFSQQSVLQSGYWQRVSVTQDGIYKLSYKELRDMGIKPEKVSIFTSFNGVLSPLIVDYTSDLQEIPIYDNGDYILFYAQSHNSWKLNANSTFFDFSPHPYWNENYFYVTSDHGVQKRIEIQDEISSPASASYTTYIDYAAYAPQDENIYHSGDDWYSYPIKSGESFGYTFEFEDVVKKKATIKTAIAAQCVSHISYIHPFIDNTSQKSYFIRTTKLGNYLPVAYETLKLYSFIPKGNKIDTKFDFSCEDAQSKCWFDHLTINITRQLHLRDKYMLFRNFPTSDTIVSYTISGSTSNAFVWDVTDIYDVKQMNSHQTNSQLTFFTRGDLAKEYVAIDLSSNFDTPTLLGTVDNQNLHGIKTPDMVIVSADDFISAANNLAELHRKEGLDVFVTTQSEIFNEFSGGKADITAIRWFMKMLYDRSLSSDKFKYLLLFGDGDLDNRMYKQTSSLVMCYESDESLLPMFTYASDDYFGLLDDDEGLDINNKDKLDIGIGRLPVRTTKEADDVVLKIDKYLNSSRHKSWCNSVCFVADDETGFFTGSDLIAEKLRRDHPEIAIKKVYLDAFERKIQSNGNRYPDAKALVDAYIKDGVLIWGYNGHGSSTSLAEEMIMCTADINNQENVANLPFWFVTACDVCPFDHNIKASFGERVLLNEKGGGIGLFTTTRVAKLKESNDLQTSFFDYAFATDNDGQLLRLGDITRLAKSSIKNCVNNRKYVLIGDPAMRLNFPKPRWTVETDSINGQYVDSYEHPFSDTLQSLSKASFSGYISQPNGLIDKEFNGFVYPILYDKISTFKTLAHSNESIEFDFLMWNSILSRGKSKVVNGRFSYSFLLPKDLDYKIGKGRIEYYATSDNVDVNGYFEDFYVGGYNLNSEIDSIAPEFDIYLNSPLFKDGATVNSSPILYANISDFSGINTSGAMVGHDIVMKIDDDPNTIKILNSNYVSQAGDYSKGMVSYLLRDLEDGPHTLSLKLWDMFNNSSTKEISFVVNKNKKPEISTLTCYPNPIALSSSSPLHFVITNDRPECRLKVLVNVFDSKGALVYSTSDYSYSETNDLFLTWDLSTVKLSAGLYYYQTIIHDEDLTSVSATQVIAIID